MVCDCCLNCHKQGQMANLKQNIAQVKFIIKNYNMLTPQGKLKQILEKLQVHLITLEKTE